MGHKPSPGYRSLPDLLFGRDTLTQEQAAKHGTVAHRPGGVDHAIVAGKESGRPTIVGQRGRGAGVEGGTN